MGGGGGGAEGDGGGAEGGGGGADISPEADWASAGREMAIRSPSRVRMPLPLAADAPSLLPL
jgi:hypothetical protein